MDAIPFTPGRNFEELSVTLDGERVIFATRWNARDNIDPATGKALGAWYFDIYAEDKSIIAIGIKAVLGVPLGRACTHTFFQRHLLKAVDTQASAQGQSKDAGFDDLGGRVQVLHFTAEELTTVF